MKKALIMAIGMTALCIHSTTLEETRRILRENIEEVGQFDTPEQQERARQIYLLECNEGDVTLSVYCELLAEHFDNPAVVRDIMKGFVNIGYNIALYENQEALNWARRVVNEKGPEFSVQAARNFLSYKGDARDIDLVSPRYSKRLVARAAGTNYIEYPGAFASELPFHITPSVTNTGPQALYVKEILRQVWNNLEIETEEGTEGWDAPLRFKDVSKIPAELLTMVVWFDEDGNPVTNVDLAKYGLTMPELDVPNKGRAKASRLAAEEPAATNVATASLPSAEDEAQLTTSHYPLTTTADTPPSRLWPYALIPLFLCVGALLWFIRKRNRLK